VNPKPAVMRDQGMTPSPVQQARRPHRPGYFFPRALLPLIRHTIKTTPWATLISGCLAGTAILAIYAYLAHKYHSPLGPTTVRLTFLIPAATLAFVPCTVFRPLTLATPVPACLAAAIQTLLAFAVLALTCWVQLRLMAYTIPGHTAGPAIYPLIAGLTGWSTIFVAVAACCDRSRFADIGGALAVPISAAAIALAWFTPGVKDLFIAPPTTARAASIAWYILAAAALALAYAAMRDHWHRYTRKPRWLSSPQRNPS
jgi:hypothetical protein